MTLTCSSPACTHDVGWPDINGNPLTYIYCNIPPGTPGDSSTYTVTMALNAAHAFNSYTGYTPSDQFYADCDGGTNNALVETFSAQGFVMTWTFSGPNAGYLTQTVGSTGQCPGSSDPTWT